MTDDSPLVLVVEDERDLAELYATWLGESYCVRSVNDGRTALDELDDEVRVVLLDRRMPDFSGDEVLDAIRDRDLDCRVAMVTAVEPDVDVIDMGFDDYLVKPVSREDLTGTVANLLARDAYDEGVRRLFSLASKKALLESESPASTLDDSEKYQQLLDDIEELRTELDDKLERFAEMDDMARVYQDIDRDSDAEE
ncbi:HalX domain-containing protein [Haloplanus salinarum]|uniref:HalX domain-containing protein n=1 Tax=Haloplanus salinarum TaxID=1912324 RepID=UPI00214C57C3|nr:HalX domain-containing protein [Haloplanus salinarum]